MMMLPEGYVVMPMLLGFGQDVWLTVGAIIAWALLAALVGSGIRLLRENARMTGTGIVRKPTNIVGFTRRATRALPHREAA